MRLILDKKCHLRLTEAAERLGELYEGLEGKAKHSFICDHCGDTIPRGDTAFAGSLRPRNVTDDYQVYRPSDWADSYIVWK